MMHQPKSLYRAFQHTAKRHTKRTALYWKHQQVWHKKKYGELLDDIDVLAHHLAELRITPNTQVAIWSENRPEWLMCDLALNKLGAVSVPIHAVANKEFAQYVTKHSESTFLVISASLYEKNKDSIPFNQLKGIIYIGESLPLDHPSHTRLFSNLLTVPSSLNKEVEHFNELASIVYTSGTTGEPKGVMLTNTNFLANVEATCNKVPVFHTDIFLSFLPLSHILERTVGSFVPITHGAAIAYAESITALQKNMQEIRPTIIISVPKIFERIYEKIVDHVKESSTVQQKIFYWALDKTPRSNGCNLCASILVYRKIRKLFGGRLRIAVSGGASINISILKFFTKVGVPIVEGYGLTETASAATTNSLSRPKIGTVGRALKHVEIKISATKEILIRGPIVTSGYWKNESETNNSFSDGWFKTGDLGFLDTDGFLKIIGRAKEIIIGTNGENIAPEKIENLLNASSYIYQSLVIGHKKPFLTALIVPQMENIEKIRKNNTSAIETYIWHDIKKINETLSPYEHIKRFYILTKPFNIENNELTPTLKLRRSIIESHNRTVIENLYIE
ncbi:MAG: long-chain fatty acid--CoA ligase [bacterium]